ncbi:uncharacterized protein B0H18DRAFT_1124287 [Fomitopsis serialis]|uniref:uncharacterized protein n=1 Tax=Fomitopsis serialis TaxID=139415 RepID=UPI0020089C12|nr:uncharacterized protein B0H18DRAFT_1124287 [Neoantrodia serialis]KAH9916374.1 hypothetical protein B0H18DRAFT_1124287 [Neoantrodia serialis]
MVCNLELESSPALREFFLRNWLVNPSGKQGHYQAGDLLQEHYNRELESFIGRNDIPWDSDFMRKVVSPNVIHFLDLKNQWREGVGLKPRRSNHPEPHSNPEVKILLQSYKDTDSGADLHRFRPGRRYGMQAKETDTFGHGVAQMLNGKLAEFVTKTTHTRCTSSTLAHDQGATGTTSQHGGLGEPTDSEAVTGNDDAHEGEQSEIPDVAHEAEDEVYDGEGEDGMTDGRVDVSDGMHVILADEHITIADLEEEYDDEEQSGDEYGYSST